MAECLTVDQDVAGSTPVSHPYIRRKLSVSGAFFYIQGVFSVVENPFLRRVQPCATILINHSLRLAAKPRFAVKHYTNSTG